MNTCPKKEKALVFFDGHCGLCNGFVNFLLICDIFDNLQFATLQGKSAQQQLSKEQYSKLDTLVVTYKGRTYEKFDGVFLAISQLNPLFKILLILHLLPKKLRDALYNSIARNRYKIFGYQDVCRRPTEKEKKKFVD